MNIKGERVISSVLGVGTVTEQDRAYITVAFTTKTSKFPFPSAFEKFLKAESEEIQANIAILLEELKAAEAAKKACGSAVESKRLLSLVAPQKTNSKNIDEMFADDYHVAYLARQPVFTYRQVEDQFGIKISGFGRGINPTPSTVVLISSIGKSQGNFVYHDKWTTDGDYLYSGEGKTGDQAMTKGNLAIKNAATDGKAIHLFVKFSPQEYYYQGIFTLVDYTYENEKDESGNIRKEYKFRLKKV